MMNAPARYAIYAVVCIGLMVLAFFRGPIVGVLWVVISTLWCITESE